MLYGSTEANIALIASQDPHSIVYCSEQNWIWSFNVVDPGLRMLINCLCAKGSQFSNACISLPLLPRKLRLLLLGNAYIITEV